ncbi:hypothetical protein [Mucilaginibacter sp.]|uniref:hypothetical protein n=1 Tax=Mucilaginibacter sp. TaxID=1882438 RepID=UPI002628582F|nr:hypothetical protein [Mucilaginibacter sp.]
MNNTRTYIYQNPFSKWLLAVVLLLSFFTFSGLVVQTQQKPNALQTTLVQINQNRVVKSITYKRALRHTQNGVNTFSFFVTSVIDLSELHSRQVKIQIASRCISNIRNLQTCFFYQHKTIPQNTSDDPAFTLV